MKNNIFQFFDVWLSLFTTEFIIVCVCARSVYKRTHFCSSETRIQKSKKQRGIKRPNFLCICVWILQLVIHFMMMWTEKRSNKILNDDNQILAKLKNSVFNTNVRTHTSNIRSQYAHTHAHIANAQKCGKFVGYACAIARVCVLFALSFSEIYISNDKQNFHAWRIQN